ncbi:unnamed protein product [Zymoseptoria tritici ST99CH_3D7]|uniref:BTB domain-containing protein n=2 Tax=Zymoseptoria tritici TaxID=1047171 RepID=A0A1X7S5A7_ZYMT9|nr:unnamed protein product [Zymoseptoria tritici ST99CH_3D7]SMR59334.1 unnamed protein product [Zymoseptoria tritici ST99CH_1E4]
MASNSGVSRVISLPYYPDVVVECGPQGAREQVFCHKGVICARSSFLARQLADPTACPSVAGNGSYIIIDSHYNGEAVEAVLRSLYTSSREMKWLQRLGWIGLLHVFQVAFLFQLHDMQPIIKTIATQKLDQINTRDEINSALEAYENLGHPTFMASHFHADVDKLKDKLSVLDAQSEAIQKEKEDAEERELANTMAMLRSPASRGDVSEEAYIQFLDAVQSSDWAGGNQD